jgi:hypothetical protein
VLLFCGSNIRCVVPCMCSCIPWCWVSPPVVLCLDYIDSFVSMEAIDLHVWVNNYFINLCLGMKVSNSVTSDYKNCLGFSLSF